MQAERNVIPLTTAVSHLFARVAAAFLLSGALLFSGCGHDESPPQPSVPEGSSVQTISLYATTAPDALPLIPGTAAYVASQATWLPDLTVYVPAQDSATGAAVIICPGGGYDHLAVDEEGTEVARYFV